MKAAGLCRSDMSFFDGSRDWSDYPLVLGHEGAGVVLECGPGVTHVQPGDHVIPVGIPENARPVVAARPICAISISSQPRAVRFG